MTIRLFHIDSSILGPQSVSRELSAAIVERYRSTYRHVELTYRDLAAAPLPHLSGAAFLAARTLQTPAAHPCRRRSRSGTSCWMSSSRPTSAPLRQT
jgi:FMN-dependent NADH-azoreductase